MPQVVGALDAGLLHGVEHVGGVLPAVEDHALDRLAVDIGDRAAHHDPVAVVGVDEHRLAEFTVGRATGMERTEHGVVGEARRAGVVGHHLDERRHAGGVGQQDELLANVVADLAALREEHDARKPLLAGQVDLAGEGVQMADRRTGHLLEARVRRVVVTRQDLGQQFVECAFFAIVVPQGC